MNTVLSTPRDLANNDKIREPFANIDHNHVYFDIITKTLEANIMPAIKRSRKKGDYGSIRKGLNELDWKTIFNNKQVSICWDGIQFDIDNAINIVNPSGSRRK